MNITFRYFLWVFLLLFFFSKLTNPENIIGVVKGVQQPNIRAVHLEVREPFGVTNSPHSSPKKSSYSGSDLSDRVLDSPSHRVAPPYKDPPAPPPYRDPPPPSSNINNDKFKKHILQVGELILIWCFELGKLFAGSEQNTTKMAWYKNSAAGERVGERSV